MRLCASVVFQNELWTVLAAAQRVPGYGNLSLTWWEGPFRSEAPAPAAE